MIDTLNIAVLPGDGIGRDVMTAALPIFDALHLPVTLTRGDFGWSCWQKNGEPIPQKTWELIRNADATLVGAITSKPPREAFIDLAETLQKEPRTYLSPLIQLRQELDLFANVRPCFNLKNEKKPFNCCIIRENTEGLYAGFDFHPVPPSIKSLLNQQERLRDIPAEALSCTLRLQSEQGLLRLFKFAFHYADSNNLTRVCFADKPNVLRQSSAFARDIFESVAASYPHLTADIKNVDAVAYWLIKRPETFGVIVAENMFGDILSDVGAAVMGGLGFAHSANIGHKGCYFEPVHGSGPLIKAHSANPSAMFLTIGLLLKQFGFVEQAKTIRRAVIQVIQQGRYTTYDVGGTSSTLEMADAIISATRPKTTAKSMRKTLDVNQHISTLSQFNTTDISDALDACGVEGALHQIKPLSFGKKLIGPAYTIQYTPYEQTNDTFQPAADYIDNVPAQSVIIIDNQARVDCTVWGGILTQMALIKGIAGTIVNGAVRDIHLIRELHYPVFCVDQCMRSGKNRVYKSHEQQPLFINGITIYPGDLIFADDHGVIVIPIDRIEEVIQKSTNIQKTEKKIIAAVNAGARLDQARADHHYNQPWLDNDNA